MCLLFTILVKKTNTNIYGPKGTSDFISDIKSAFKKDIEIRVVPPESHSKKGLKTNTVEIKEGLIFKKNTSLQLIADKIIKIFKDKLNIIFNQDEVFNILTNTNSSYSKSYYSVLCTENSYQYSLFSRSI